MAIFLLITIFAFTGISACKNALLTMLFDNYDPNMRPVCNGAHSPVNVTMDLALRQLVDLNEPAQLLELSVWIRLYWNDCRLGWNETHFDGQAAVVVPEVMVWTPDIEVYDGISDDIRRGRAFRVAITSTGDVRFLFQAVIDARCTVDVTSFPFDEQHCPLSFGSWAYHGNDLNIIPKSGTGDLTSMVENVEWDIEGFSTRKETEYFACCDEPYPFLTYTLSIKRKPNFYIINLILPSVFVMALTMMVFFVPADSGEKVSFAVTLMLALAVFQLMLADALPASAETVPLIAGYFAVSEGLVGFVCVAAIIVLNIHSRGDKRMPKWVRKVFLGVLLNVVCVTSKHDKHKYQSPEEFENHIDADTQVNNCKGLKEHGESSLTLAEEWKLVAMVIERITAAVFIPALLIISLYVFINLTS